MLGWIPTIGSELCISLTYCGQIGRSLLIYLGTGNNFIFSTLALSDCASYLIACRKYSTACSYSLKNVFLDHGHGGLGLPQRLLIILVLVLLRCLGDQVYGLLQGVARHGRHSTKLPAL